jgi:putative DNA primase/helicase
VGRSDSYFGSLQISVPMFKQIKGDRQKNLIEHKKGQMSGEFLPYIPGLLNWVLAMDAAEATRIVKNYEESVPSLLAMKARTLVETNPIADWLDNFIIYEKEARTNVGVAKRDKDNNSPCWYLDTDRWLYPNYAEYCHNSGTRPVSLRRFVTLLSDLGKNQLGLEIRKERDRFGSYFVGLKIRSEDDLEPSLITGNTSVVINTKSSSSSTNVINRLWTMLMDKVTDIIVTVMDESIATDEYDMCDGIFKKSPKIENKNEDCQVHGSQKEKPERLEEFSKMPSYPSAIKVGDHVMIDDCPGHWAWASPFTVEGIDGEMVKLEMVGELVEMKRLERV